jgi:osmotically-inducible protein OsmY
MLKKLLMSGSAACLIIAVGCSQTDPGVTTAVKSKLAADDTVKAYQINVDTADGVVTLSGTVETPAAKDQAVSLARQTDGVRDVVDRITVNPEAAATTGNLADETRETAREAREEARQGAETARDTAAGAADRTQNAVTDAAITSGVKGKFLADTAVSGLKIDVDTRDGVVTLTGTVSTSAEADRAMVLARETNGVTRVINNLQVRR